MTNRADLLHLAIILTPYFAVLYQMSITLSVNIYRDGTHIGTTSGGSYTDSNLGVGGGSYTYQVCKDGTDDCSNYATVNF